MKWQGKPFDAVNLVPPSSAFSSQQNLFHVSMDVANAFLKVQKLSAELRKFPPEIASLLDVDGASADHAISLLQAKSATLLRYNRNLIRLVQLKAEGEPIQPIAEKLVADWVALERIRPLEKKIRHQIDSLLRAVAAQAIGKESEADRFKRRQSSALFESGGDESDEKSDEGVGHETEEEQVAEKTPLDATTEVMHDEQDARKDAQEAKERTKKQARVLRDEDVREMLAELKGRPDELRDDDFGGAKKNRVLQRLLQEDEERMKYEEEHMTRLNVSRKDKKRRRNIVRAMEGPGLDGMDEFSGLIAVADRVISHRKDKGDEGKVMDSAGDDEEIKIRQLEKITEHMSGGKVKSSSKSVKKRRRR